MQRYAIEWFKLYFYSIVVLGTGVANALFPAFELSGTREFKNLLKKVL